HVAAGVGLVGGAGGGLGDVAGEAGVGLVLRRRVVQRDADVLGRAPVADGDAVGLIAAQDQVGAAAAVGGQRVEPGVVGVDTVGELRCVRAGEGLAVDDDAALAIAVHDPVVAVAGAEVVEVGALATEQAVAADAAVELVVTGAAEQRVGSIASVQLVG